MSLKHITRNEEREEMYYDILNSTRKRERKCYNIIFTEFEDKDVILYIKQNPFTKVSLINQTGLPLITEYKSTKNPMFGKKYWIFGKKLLGSLWRTGYVKEIETYLKRPEDLAFIMPNGHFIFKKDGEDLENVAERLIKYDVKLSEKFTDFEDISSKAELVLNEMGAIGIVERYAIVNVSNEFKNNARRRIWMYIILNTTFIKVKGLIVV